MSNKYFLNFFIIVLSFLITSETKGQYLWKVTHSDEANPFHFAFTSISCSGDNCTAAGLKIDDTSHHIKILFFRSNNGGITWQEQDPDLPYQLGQNQNSITTIQQIDSLNVVGIGDTGLIVRTFDGGNTWEKQDCHNPAILTDIHFSDPLNGIAVSAIYPQIHTTTDGGKHWNDITFNVVDLNQCHSFGSGRFRASKYGHGPIYTTNNNWQSIDSTDPLFNKTTDPGYRYVLPYFNFSGGDTILAYGTYWDSILSAITVIMRSTDGGKDWATPYISSDGEMTQKISSITNLDRDTIIAGATESNQKILFSSDRGATWRIDSILLDTNYFTATTIQLTMTGDGHPIGIFSSIFFPGNTSILARGEYRPSTVDAYERIVNATRVYPNPATNLLNILSNDPLRPVHILDVLGREVLRGLISENGRTTLNVSSLTYGVYYIQLDHFGKILPIGKFAISR